MSCSFTCRAVMLRSTKPSARSARIATSLTGPDRPAVAGRDPPGVDDHVVGAHARALDLEVAADAAAEVGDPAPVLERRLRVGARPDGPSDHRDQVLVVGAVELVGVGDRPGLAAVVGDLVLVAARIVGRGGSRPGLGVDARHDDDAVVVARCGHRGLDLVVVALAPQAEVDRRQPCRLEPSEPALVVRADLIAAEAARAGSSAQAASASRTGRRRGSGREPCR